MLAAAEGRCGTPSSSAISSATAPNEVIERLRGLDPLATIRGNHDKAACGIEDGSNFNHALARTAASWTYDVLTPAHHAYLRQLPAGPQAIDDHIEICHGAPFDEDHYIFDADDALVVAGGEHLADLPVRAHAPAGRLPLRERDVRRLRARGRRADDAVARAEARYLINVGSVGQPRDGDPRAGYGIYDAGGLTITMCRVAIRSTARSVASSPRAAGEPGEPPRGRALISRASRSSARDSRFFNSMANASAAARDPRTSR